MSVLMLSLRSSVGSASGTGRPTIIASAVAEAGSWWQLDSGCIRQEEGPLWLCEQRGKRQVGSVFFQWDQVIMMMMMM